MTHPTPKERKRLAVLMEQLDWLFGVSSYERHLLFKKKDKDGAMAEITIDASYERIVMNIYPMFWEESREEQRAALLHEYCHHVAYPLQLAASLLYKGELVTPNDQEAAVEKTTSRICHLLDAQLRGRNKFARIAYKKYL